MDFLQTVSEQFSGLIMLGEAGSGKTELSLNSAIFLAQKHEVHFFDMDQSKPMFRSRDAKAFLEQSGIALHHSQSVMDAPTIPGGVAEALRNSQIYPVMDVGGSIPGARMMGQFLRDQDLPKVAVLYVLNIYRPHSRNLDLISRTMQLILEGSGVRDVKIVLNPNKGVATTQADVLAGAAQSITLLKQIGREAAALAVREDLYDPAAFEAWESIMLVRQIIPTFYGIT